MRALKRRSQGRGFMRRPGKGRPGEGSLRREFDLVTKTGAHWSEREVERVVSAYFEMLALELRGLEVAKARCNEALRAELDNRSKGSVEFKHCNISAVMVALGLPFVDGYKPRANYQGLLAEAVVAYLNAHPAFFVEAAEQAAAVVLQLPRGLWRQPGGLSRLFVPGPLPLEIPRDPRLYRALRVVSVDFAQRDQANTRLVEAGIELTVELERYRLAHEHGRLDLAQRVRAVATDASEGFQVLSFGGDDERERHIGVKTTVLGKHAPFQVSAREVQHAEALGDRYALFRIFEAARDPRVYARRGPLTQGFRLEPTSYTCAV